MERTLGKMWNAGQVPAGGIAGWATRSEDPGLCEWSGRFWLPAGDRVDPTRKFCLIRDDGQAGEMIMDRFGSSDIGRDVAVFQGNRSRSCPSPSVRAHP